ncbi:MAG: hypothetical protein NTU58_01105 [Candidatus Nealsonbacteria bacterium]|nr:hypothetical protein [Candidatus Nealsonbacteria bacterium]
MNKKISTPIAIGIILILSVALIIFTYWQIAEIEKNASQIIEIKVPEKEEMATSTIITVTNFEECVANGYQVDNDTYSHYPYSSLCKTPGGDVFIKGIDNNRIYVEKENGKIVAINVGEKELKINEIIPNLVEKQEISAGVKEELESKAKEDHKECSTEYEKSFIVKIFKIELDDNLETEEYVVDYWCGGQIEFSNVYKKIGNEWKTILDVGGWVDKIEKTKINGMHNLLIFEEMGLNSPGIETRYKWNSFLNIYEEDQKWDVIWNVSNFTQ